MDTERASLRYVRILRAVCTHPWAIQPERLTDICDVLAFQATGGKLTAEEIREYVGQGPGSRSGVERSGAVAMLPLRGIISHRIEMMDDLSGPGGTSTERFGSRFREALADPQVGTIVLDIDSPGGSVDGVPELAAEVREARGVKPIVALADTAAASAAYWIAAAADEISVTPSGQVGSIGVYAAHRDISAALEREGERVTLVSAGPRKVDGNPYEPLSDAARADIQKRVDEVYGQFLASVSAGRGVSVDRVREDYGQGRTMGADEALAAGLVDRIETRHQMLARLTEPKQSVPARRARALRHPAEFAFARFNRRA